ncbi:Cyclic nucleotide-binding protein [Pseudocohnilembus persalinus]|uniref:Cyclic nucleotide-binding protein n=1 Tax=Pseudocohnilembus persalinus TaxID=266149 RepID=A0A0V0QI88_PSEPJ|nr:Cyclic nucleotide-binding protein [Pseudocohnilembus persalinus]|eukprot:KRX01934.1 Cyclic nucleotide-binding protein [Pseudocohnilembus persalinus]
MPEIIAYYSEGDILKLEDKDKFNLQLLDIWYITSTDLEVFEISKDKFNRLTNKLKLFEFYQQKIDGFYIITQGEVECEVPQEKAEQNLLIDNNQFNIIESIFKDPNGGYIGENLLFSSIGLSRFGQLKAKSNKVYCLFLPKENFYRLNIMDKETMKQNSRKTEYFKKCQKQLNCFY